MKGRRGSTLTQLQKLEVSVNVYIPVHVLGNVRAKSLQRVVCVRVVRGIFA